MFPQHGQKSFQSLVYEDCSFFDGLEKKHFQVVLVPQIGDGSSTGYAAEKKKEVLDHRHAQRMSSTVKALSKHLEYNPFLYYL